MAFCGCRLGHLVRIPVPRMSAALLNKRSALIVYGWLVVLTLLEVAVIWSGMPKHVGLVVMGLTTFSKVMMIGLYFMHVMHDRPIAWLLPTAPVVLGIIFVLALFPDLVYRLPLLFR